jgi:hypothetical protein
LYGEGYPGARPFDRVWVFLAPGRFAPKTPDYGGWISLDSLVRIDTFQWVKRDKSPKVFLALYRASGAPERRLTILVCARAGLSMGASLISFLIFCNQNVVRAVTLQRTQPKAARFWRQVPRRISQTEIKKAGNDQSPD